MKSFKKKINILKNININFYKKSFFRFPSFSTLHISSRKKIFFCISIKIMSLLLNFNLIYYYYYKLLSINIHSGSRFLLSALFYSQKSLHCSRPSLCNRRIKEKKTRNFASARFKKIPRNVKLYIHYTGSRNIIDELRSLARNSFC